MNVGWVELSETQQFQDLWVLGYPAGSRFASTFLKRTLCSSRETRPRKCPPQPTPKLTKVWKNKGFRFLSSESD
jgi:hypothetical protein